MIRLCRVLKALLCAGLMLAAQAHANPTWTSFGAVSQLSQQPGHGIGADMVFVYVGPASPSVANQCSIRNGFYFAVNNDRTKRIFTMLLTAQATNRPVRVWFNSALPCQGWGFAPMEAVEIQ